MDWLCITLFYCRCTVRSCVFGLVAQCSTLEIDHFVRSCRSLSM